MIRPTGGRVVGLRHEFRRTGESGGGRASPRPSRASQPPASGKQHGAAEDQPAAADRQAHRGRSTAQSRREQSRRRDERGRDRADGRRRRRLRRQRRERVGLEFEVLRPAAAGSAAASRLRLPAPSVRIAVCATTLPRRSAFRRTFAFTARWNERTSSVRWTTCVRRCVTSGTGTRAGSARGGLTSSSLRVKVGFARIVFGHFIGRFLRDARHRAGGTRSVCRPRLRANTGVGRARSVLCVRLRWRDAAASRPPSSPSSRVRPDRRRAARRRAGHAGLLAAAVRGGRRFRPLALTRASEARSSGSCERTCSSGSRATHALEVPGSAPIEFSTSFGKATCPGGGSSSSSSGCGPSTLCHSPPGRLAQDRHPGGAACPVGGPGTCAPAAAHSEPSAVLRRR